MCRQLPSETHRSRPHVRKKSELGQHRVPRVPAIAQLDQTTQERDQEVKDEIPKVFVFFCNELAQAELIHIAVDIDVVDITSAVVIIITAAKVDFGLDVGLDVRLDVGLDVLLDAGLDLGLDVGLHFLSGAAAIALRRTLLGVLA